MKIDPCPFCGNPNIKKPDDEGYGDYENISCGKCKSEGPYADDLEDAILKWNERDDSAPYLDKSHPYYSEELSVTISAWREMFENGQYDEDKAPKEQIEMSVRNNKLSQGLTPAAINRIAVLINPKPGGGAPRTKEK